MTKWFGNIHLNALWALIQIPLLSPVIALTDNRCYLENGASSENFFVSEDTEIGKIIGTIHIHGDPRLNIGNIVLKLKENDSPIDIIPGTKNLTLTEHLDKEGIDGPSSVFINLICERLPLHQLIDPDFLIPINIRVTDVNDNSPIFINAPYILNISEVTVIGTRVLQGVLAIDNDQPGPNSNIRYQVLPGPYSDYFQFENELDGTLVLKKQLDYETLRSFNVNIRAQDHGQPPKKTDTILTVHIIDADDQNPRFLDDKYAIELNQTRMKRGSVLPTKPKDIKAYDQDLGINAPIFYTFNNNNNNEYFKINRNNGKIILLRDINNIDEFKHPITLVIRAQQEDNPDRYALTTLTIIKRSIDNNNKIDDNKRNFDDDVRFLQKIYNFRVRENLPIGSIIGTLTNNHPELNLRYFVNDLNILKTLSLNTKGEVLLKAQLDFEETPGYYFKVFATDGVTNDSCVVNVTVEDINEWEPRFRYPYYEFFVNNNQQQQQQRNILIGKIEAADGDRNDKLTLTLSGKNASLFFLTPTGELCLRNQLNSNNTFNGIANLLVTANDNGNPPRKATVPITVHFPDNLAYNSSLRNSNNSISNGTPFILAGLGAILLILTFIIALLIAYICKARQSIRPELPPLSSPNGEKPENISNPMFTASNASNNNNNGNIKSATASAIGGIPSDLMKTKYPAPQPPNWPLSQSTSTSSTSTRMKKLSWDDNKTDNTDNSSTDNNIDTIPRLIENSNLTVYF